jgi:hypothetical protein
MGRPRPVACNGATDTYLGNQKPAALCHWGPWDHSTYTVEDLATGWVRFAGGATLSIESSFAAHIEKDVWTLQLMGTKGGALYDPVTVFTDQNGFMVDVKPGYLGRLTGSPKRCATSSPWRGTARPTNPAARMASPCNRSLMASTAAPSRAARCESGDRIR